MKLFKELLAVALIGVMALTVLAGCSTTIDPDTQFENSKVWEAYDKLTNSASDAGYNSNVTYSRKLSSVAKAMYSAVNSAYGIGGEYSADYDKAAKAAFEKAKADGTISAKAELKVGYLVTNPAGYDSFDYKSVFTDSEYDTANTVGIYWDNTYNNLMIVAAYIPASK